MLKNVFIVFIIPNLIKIGCLLGFFFFAVWDHVGVHIFSGLISSKPTKSLGIKTVYAKSCCMITPYDIFKCLAYDWTAKDEWMVT